MFDKVTLLLLISYPANLDQKTAKFERRCLVEIENKEGRERNIEDSKVVRWETVDVDFDLLIGADGAHSVTRKQLFRYAKINFQQTWVDTLWCEFLIPSSEDGGFRLSSNHLHLWPQKSCMFIASPNTVRTLILLTFLRYNCTDDQKNGTFTSQLFAPQAIFDELKASPANIEKFFQHNFPGVTPNLISREVLQNQVLENPHLSLIDIKCSSYHYRDSCVIVGDAAHAMVPFYGQGLNTGFEDVRILFEDFLDRSSSHPTHAIDPSNPTDDARLQAYSAFRQPDAHAMNELALQHYETLRVGVLSYPRRVRGWIEECLSLHAPWLGWATLYSRVAFENGRYSDVTRQARRQESVLQTWAGMSLTLIFSAALLLVVKAMS